MKNDLIYVFGITDNPPGPYENLASDGLETVLFDDFYVVIKFVPEKEFSTNNLKKNLSDFSWLEIKIAEHIRVVNKIMDHTPVIPLKFGTVYNSESDLNKFFRDYHSSLKENFLKIRGKEEWTVKIYCNRRILSAQIDDINKVATDLEKQIMASPPGKAYLLQRKKSELIKAEMDRICSEYSKSHFNNLKSYSELSSLNIILNEDIISKAGTMILNASFLVKKDRVPVFRNASDSLQEENKGSGFLVETKGPFPPYSFVNLTKKW
jgi:hypothetical protein